MKNAMAVDYSWSASAGEYVEAYKRVAVGAANFAP
jgi:glycogen synthase